MNRSAARIAGAVVSFAILLAGSRAGAAATLSLPDDATAAAGASVAIAISAIPADGILGADIQLQYDADVLIAVSVEKTAISQPFTLTANLLTPGVVRVSVFNTLPMAGSGEILVVNFDVVGLAGESSALDLTFGQFNEGAIPTDLVDGLFSICIGPPAEVADVALSKTPVTTLAWDAAPGASAYDVASGEALDLRLDGGATGAVCLQNDVAGTGYADTRPDPASGVAYYYLVRAQSGCGAGPYGLASSGAPRIPLLDCP